jgi:hypothetical protein
VVYKKGILNGAADTLSRKPVVVAKLFSFSTVQRFGLIEFLLAMTLMNMYSPCSRNWPLIPHLILILHFEMDCSDMTIAFGWVLILNCIAKLFLPFMIALLAVTLGSQSHIANGFLCSNGQA